MPSFHSIVAPPKPIARRPQSVSSPPTDRDMLKQHLAQAEGYMAMSKGHIASQRKFVAGLLIDGRDASQALALLLRFEELQELHVADCGRLRGELSR
jgi:hypothetical protein